MYKKHVFQWPYIGLYQNDLRDLYGQNKGWIIGPVILRFTYQYLRYLTQGNKEKDEM